MEKVNNLGVLLIWFSLSLSAENCDESDSANIIIEDGNVPRVTLDHLLLQLFYS